MITVWVLWIISITSLLKSLISVHLWSLFECLGWSHWSLSLVGRTYTLRNVWTQNVFTCGSAEIISYSFFIITTAGHSLSWKPADLVNQFGPFHNKPNIALQTVLYIWPRNPILTISYVINIMPIFGHIYGQDRINLQIKTADYHHLEIHSWIQHCPHQTLHIHTWRSLAHHLDLNEILKIHVASCLYTHFKTKNEWE